MKLITLITLSILPLFTFSQTYDPNHLPNTYKSNENQNYWKNKQPYEGGWQQDVAYKIEAFINDSTDIIEGDFFKLTYWNNSPVTLKEIYFHLYQNKFQPQPHMHDLYMNNDCDMSYGKYEKKGLGTTIEEVRING